MKKVRLGNTDLLVSEFCLGCMYFGWREERGQSWERLDQYVAAGGNFLDTANIYSGHSLKDKDYFGKDIDLYVDGASERLLGEWMKQRQNRHELILASKVGFPYPRVPYGTGASRIKSECDKSLLRLGTDYLDLYYLHTDDIDTPMEESLGALDELVKEGKVRQIGASNFSAWRLERALQISRHNGWAEYCCIQQRYTYLRPKSGWDFGGQKSVNDDLLDYVKDSGLTLLAYSPLLRGAYVDPAKPLMAQYVGPDSDSRLQALTEIASEVGATKNQLVYYYLLHTAPPAIPLVASSSAGQFDEALGTLSLSLSTEQMARLEKARF